MSSFPTVYAGHPRLSAAPGASAGMGLWCTQDPGIWGRGSGNRGLDLGRAQRAARKGEGKACSLQNLDTPTKLWHAEGQAWRAGALHAQHLWLLSAGALQPRGGGQPLCLPTAHARVLGTCLPACCHALSAGPGTCGDSQALAIARKTLRLKLLELCRNQHVLPSPEGTDRNTSEHFLSSSFAQRRLVELSLPKQSSM